MRAGSGWTKASCRLSTRLLSTPPAGAAGLELRRCWSTQCIAWTLVRMLAGSTLLGSDAMMKRPAGTMGVVTNVGDADDDDEESDGGLPGRRGTLATAWDDAARARFGITTLSMVLAAGLNGPDVRGMRAGFWVVNMVRWYMPDARGCRPTSRAAYSGARVLPLRSTGAAAAEAVVMFMLCEKRGPRMRDMVDGRRWCGGG
jgi:hypothetical protein